MDYGPDFFEISDDIHTKLSSRGDPAKSTWRTYWSSSPPSARNARSKFRAKSTSKPRGARVRSTSKICSLFLLPLAKSVATSDQHYQWHATPTHVANRTVHSLYQT